jgi:AcrR family transcriptional regulator
VRADVDFAQSPRDMLRNTIVSFLRYIDANRASWIVMYTQAISSQAFAHTVREGREQIIELVAGLVRAGSRTPRADVEHQMMAVALVGAGEAMANRLSTGDIEVDDAAELLIDLFWHGLRGAPEDREAAAEAGGANAATG